MLPRLSFRYGYTFIERSGLVLWTLGWGAFLFVAIQSGTVSYNRVDYSRIDAPVAYWAIIAVLIALCIFGLGMTFELSFAKDEDTAAEKKDE